MNREVPAARRILSAAARGLLAIVTALLAGWPPALAPAFLLAFRAGLAGRRARWRAAGRHPREGRQLALPHLLHHLLHHLAAFEQLVDLLDRRAGAARDPLAPAAVDHVRDGTLVRGHRAYDRFDPAHLAL